MRNILYRFESALLNRTNIKCRLQRSWALALFGLLFGLPAATVAAQTPGLDETQFVAVELSNQPIKVGSTLTCLDVESRYAAVKTQSFRASDVNIFDLQTGKIVKSFDTGERLSGRLVSISTDLKRALYKPTAGEGIDLWDISNAPTKICTLPFARPRLNGSLHEQSFFASSDRIVLKEMNGGKGFTIWNARNGRFISQSKVTKQRNSLSVNTSRYQSNMQGNQVRVTPDRRYLFAQNEIKSRSTNRVFPGPVLKFYDLANGRFVQKVELDAEADQCGGVQMSPDGTKLVSVASSGKTFRNVFGFKSNDGSRQFKIPFPKDAIAHGTWNVQWLDDDHFLIGNVLASFSQKKILARLANFKPKHIVASTGQAIFYKASYLTVENVLEEIEPALATSDPKVATVLKAGEAVSVAYEIPDNAPFVKFEDQFEYAVYKSLTESGLTLRKDGKAKLTIVVDEQSTGKLATIAKGVVDKRLEKMLPNRPAFKNFKEEKRFTVPLVNLNCRWTLEIPSVGVIDSKDFEIGFPPDSEIFSSDRERLIKFARRWRWEELLDTLQGQFSSEYVHFDLPTIAFDHGPSQDWLADAKSQESAKTRDDLQAKLSFAKEQRLRERESRALASDRKKFDRQKLNGDIHLLANSSVPTPWDFQPTGLPPLKASVGRSPLHLSLNKFETVDSVRYATSKTAQAVVHVKALGNKNRVDRYDLIRNRRVSSTQLQGRLQLHDVRPDGKVWMVSSKSPAKRLKIYKTTKRSEDELVADLEVAERSIGKARFAGRNTILVWDANGCRGYQLPSGDQIFELKTDTGGGWARYNEDRQAVTSDRRCFVFRGARGLELHSTSDGAIIGELKVSVPQKEVLAVSFRNDSKRLAVLSKAGLDIFDLEAGQQCQQVCCSNLRAPLRWLNDDLLMANRQVVSLETGAIVWQYGGGLKWPFSGLGASSGWVTTKDSAGSQSLVRKLIPDPSILKTIRKFEDEAPRLLSADDRIEIVFEAPASAQAAKETMVTALTLALEGSGFDVVADSETKVRITVEAPRSFVGSSKLGAENEGDFFATNNFIYRAKIWLSKDGADRLVRTIEFRSMEMDYALDWSAKKPAEAYQQLWQAEMARRIATVPFPSLTPSTDRQLGKTSFDRLGEMTSEASSLGKRFE